MDSITYEDFIRMCWQSKSLKNGACTYEWDSLVSAEYQMKQAVWEPNISQKTKLFKKQKSKIMVYIDKAIDKIIERSNDIKDDQAIDDFLDLKNKSKDCSSCEELHDLMKKAIEDINKYLL